MPILSMNFGISSVKGVYIDDSGAITNHLFRYPYSSDLYNHFYNENDYYSDVVDYFFKEMGASVGNTQIIATGFPSIPRIRQKIANEVTYDKLVQQIDRFDVIGLTDSTIFTQNDYKTQYDISKLKLGPNEKNYLLNLALYNNAIPEKPSEYNLVLASIWNMFNMMNKDPKAILMGSRSRLFLGDIFSSDRQDFEKIAYLYILSYMLNPGISSICVDRMNDLPHYLHLKLFNKDLSHLYDEFGPTKLGTLINSPGDTVCLIKNEMGTDQLVEVPNGRIFFIPFSDTAQTRVVVKGKVIGDIEKIVSGGKLGLIVDTRQKHDTNQYDYEQLQMDINSNLKSIDEVLRKI